jgi:ABC-type branched-subunit amino acid transport system permease subunit
MEYLLHLLILVGIYVMLAQSLNLSAGFVGMPNSIAANMRQIIYGGILIFMMFRYSRGLSPRSSML